MKRNSWLLPSSFLVLSGCGVQLPSNSSDESSSEKMELHLIGESMDEARADKILAALTDQNIAAHKVNVKGGGYTLAVTPPDIRTAEAVATDIVESEQSKIKTITPPARGCPKMNRGPIFEADFLYWKMQEDNLTYALREVDNSLNSMVTPSRIVVKEQTFRWSPGFKAALGYNLPYDSWDFIAVWTHIQTHTKTSVSEPNFGIVPVLSPEGTSSTGATFANSNWKIKFNSLDVGFGRSSFISPKLSFRPEIGVKGAWIEQFLKVHYDGFASSASSSNNTPTVKGKIEFKGLGPLIDIHGRWLFGPEIGFFGGASASLLYGDFDVRTVYSGANSEDRIPVFYNKHRMRGMTAIDIGADWGKCLHDKCYIYLSLGYETQMWWDQMMLISLSNLNPEGDLQMHGFTGKFRIEF